MSNDASALFVIEGHSYDEGTIRWALNLNKWHRLKGPLGNDRRVQRSAIVWLDRK